jgi:hypothetical protein
MVHVYINYPNPHFTVHGDPTCPHIKKGRKAKQRSIRITAADPAEIRDQFADEAIKFSSTKELNDMWLEISLDAPEVEIGIVNYIREILGERYKRLHNAPSSWHCPKG